LSSLEQWARLLVAVGAVLGSVIGLARVIVKRFPPRAAGLATEVQKLRTEIETVRTTAQQQVDAARREATEQVDAARREATEQVGAAQADMRVLTDYVHDLREHIALGRQPPPPDWPEGLRL